MRKLFIVVETEKDHRFRRLSQEVRKRKRMQLESINAYTSLVTLEGISSKNRAIEISKNDMFWVLSNSMINHYLIKCLSGKKEKIRIWPDVAAVDFSDKFLTAKFFEEIGIATPGSVLLNRRDYDEAIDYLGGFPLVIKKNIGTIGRYVELVRSKKEIESFMELVFNNAKANDIPANRIAFLLQKYIPECKGEDIRVLCLNGKIIGAIRRIAGDGGFKANISLGGTAEPYEVDRELNKMCKEIINKGKIFYAGLDFLKTNEGYSAIEVNTSAQFKGFETATGINVAEKIIDQLIKK